MTVLHWWRKACLSIRNCLIYCAVKAWRIASRGFASTKKTRLKGFYFNTSSQSTKLLNPNLQFFDSLQIGFCSESQVTVDYTNPSRSDRKRPFANKSPIHQHVCTHSLTSYAPLLRNRLYRLAMKHSSRYHCNIIGMVKFSAPPYPLVN